MSEMVNRFVDRVMRSVPQIFFVVALGFSSTLALLTPPFQVVDESGHFLYSRAVAAGILLPTSFETGEVGAMLPAEHGAFSRQFDPISQVSDRVTLERLKEETRTWSLDRPEVITNFWNQAIYTPFVYFVPAAALFVADQMNLDLLSSFYFGRLANSLAFALVGALALALLPANRLLLAVVMLLPMTASLAGSFSADGFVISVSALCCALMARQIEGEETPLFWPLIGCWALILILATTKQPMIALLIPFALACRRRSIPLTITLTLVALLAFAGWQFLVASSPTQVDKLATVGANPSEQVWGLLHAPWQVFPVAFHTLIAGSAQYMFQMIGALGWMPLLFRAWFYLIVFCGLVYLSLQAMGDRGTRSANWAFLAAVLLGFGLTFGALYVAWTPPGDMLVRGVQGRYFLPFAAAIALALRFDVRAMRGNVPRTIAVGVAAGLVVIIIPYTIRIISDGYYG